MFMFNSIQDAGGKKIKKNNILFVRMRLKALLPEVQVKQGIRELEPFGGKPSQYRGKHLLFKQVDILDTRH